MRHFTWRRGRRHRPGLQFLTSTGRHHGAESLEESRVLLALDFAGDVVDVVSQPFKISFATCGKRRSHTPDYLAVTRRGVWLIDVRPEPLIKESDRESFAAAAEVAVACGWRYAVAAVRSRRAATPAAEWSGPHGQGGRGPLHPRRCQGHGRPRLGFPARLRNHTRP